MYLERLVHISRESQCGSLLVPVVRLEELSSGRCDALVFGVVCNMDLILRAQIHKLRDVVVSLLVLVPIEFHLHFLQEEN